MSKSTETLLVGGMSCQHCARHVEESLSQLDGVYSVSVELNGGLATVEFASGTVTFDQFEDAITQAGYEALGTARPDRSTDSVGRERSE